MCTGEIRLSYMTDIKKAVKDMAHAHGFDLCHITQPVIDSHFIERFNYWLQHGYYGAMTWMGESVRVRRRKNPALMLDRVRSVITVAMRYTPPGYTLAETSEVQGRGIVAAYAHGNDYHDIMKKRLKSLACDLDSFLGSHEQRIYVDTAPVLEHALAERAGLGWQGKHSLTIHRRLGSWFLLGELFTTAVLPTDEPAVNHCGSCTACMDICPTRAIVAPYIVDARRCISYLTIEYRGFIAHELRPLMGRRIYGCDDCQIVCPWNRHAGTPDSDLLAPRGENILPELASLLALDDAAFRMRFRKSPVRRSGRVALLRNVCIAMGNDGGACWLEPLVAVLQDDAPLIRAHAFWALTRLNVRQNMLLPILKRAMAREFDNDVREDMNISMQNTKGNI